MSTGHSDCQPPKEAPGPDSAVPCALLALREWVTMPPSRDMRVAQRAAPQEGTSGDGSRSCHAGDTYRPCAHAAALSAQGVGSGGRPVLGFPVTQPQVQQLRGRAAPGGNRQRRGFHTVKAGGWGSEKPTCVCEGVGPTQPRPAPPRGDTASHCPGLRTLSGRWARRRSARHRSAGHVGERRAVLPRQARLSHWPAPGV